MTNKTKSKKKRQTTRKARPEQVHELKITLKNSKPPIWRQVAVPSDIPLGDLHWVIQIVMGWTNSHLHQFIIPSNRPRPTKDEIHSMRMKGQWHKLAEYTRRGRLFSDPRFELEDIEDERKVKLCELAPDVKSKLIYEYDFGDGWNHIIEAKKIGPPQENVNYPVCLNGEFACPPEDCGGIWSYYEMLEILEDPKHEQYEEYAGWLGGDFDPEYFDIGQVNSVLANFEKEIKQRRRWEIY